MSNQRIIKFEYELYCITGLSLLLASVVAINGSGWLQVVRVVLGLPFILFFPGYMLIAALFPKKNDLSGIERVALSFGLNIAVVPLIGLGLNYTSWGIRLTPMLISLIVFIFFMSGIALYRRSKLTDEELYIPSFEFELPVIKEMSVVDRVLSAVLVLAILFAIGSICYVIAVPKTGEKFTEFYILGMGGKAEDYPTNLSVGEKGQVIVGVVNHEYGTVKYTVQVKVGDVVQSASQPIVLSNEQKYEAPVSFVADKPGQNLKVEFMLYRNGDTVPYRSLHIWVNVKAPPAGQTGGAVISSTSE